MSSSVCVCVGTVVVLLLDCVFTPYYDICISDFFLLTERETKRVMETEEEEEEEEIEAYTERQRQKDKERETNREEGREREREEFKQVYTTL